MRILQDSFFVRFFVQEVKVIILIEFNDEDNVDTEEMVPFMLTLFGFNNEYWL